MNDEGLIMSEPSLYAVSAAELLASSVTWPSDKPKIITGLSSDSQTTQAGDLFIAYAGPQQQRVQFIEHALSKGAVGVLYDPDSTPGIAELIPRYATTLPIVAVPQLQQQVGPIAARFYRYPAASMKIIGITGTNGKTSISHFIAKALQQLHHACGVIGTLGNGFPDELKPSPLTTPDAISLQRELACLKQQGAKTIAMEVSSHSLAQYRVAGVQFDTAVFTNLTQDHLDFHKDMQAYGNAKERLFLQPGLQYAVINCDDAFGLKLIEKFSSALNCYAYSTEGKASVVPLISAQAVKINAAGFSAKIKTPWGEGLLTSHLLGRFNLSNLLATLTVLGILEIPLADILHCISTLTTVPGRMQMLGGGKLPLVVVDYSHTPDALEKALKALREHCHGKLWCVFGCGGNRDASKRAIMGQTAERYSDQLIITNDNPRFEDPETITAAIVKGLLCPWAAEIEHNRGAAIAHAIDCASAGDVVLIAGKGHERYQQIGAEKIPFNDAEQVQIQLRLKINPS